jgi:DNA primase large subunit
VAFERVPDLVATRKILLVRGSAFVSRYELASLMGGHFRASLSQALTQTARKWASFIAAQEAQRLAPLVEALSTR